MPLSGETMAKLEWEWTVGSDRVRAVLEMPSAVESVFLGGRLLSRSAPGGIPGGHAVPLPGVEARVHFGAATRECFLTLNGTAVNPTRVSTKSSSALPIIVALLVGGLFLMGIFGALAVYGVRKYAADAKTSQANVALSQKYEGPNGLLVAHYPADFAAQARGEDALQVSRAGLRDDSILLIAIKRPISNDPAELSRVVLKPILDAFAAKGSVTTKSEGAGQCLDRMGYKTEGVATVGVEDVITWSCTFMEGGHAYVFFVSVNSLFEGDMPLAQRIVDATDIVGAPRAAPAPSHKTR